jgi:hypothetical protein
MNKRLLFVPVLILFTTISMAQQVPGAMEKTKKGCGCGYSSLYSIGLLEGEAGGKMQLQTIQGIRYGKWFTGIGVGLDYYQLRGIPVFLDIRRDLLNRKNSPFIYADGGVHFAWAEKKDKPNWGRTKFSNGFYYDLGLGYKLAASKQSAFIISAGYSFKYLEEERVTPLCLNWNCNEETSEYFKYRLNRLSLKIGMQL